MRKKSEIYDQLIMHLDTVCHWAKSDTGNPLIYWTLQEKIESAEKFLDEIGGADETKTII